MENACGWVFFDGQRSPFPRRSLELVFVFITKWVSPRCSSEGGNRKPLPSGALIGARVTALFCRARRQYQGLLRVRGRGVNGAWTAYEVAIVVVVVVAHGS